MKQLASTYSISGAAVTLTGVNVPLNQILLISDATTGNVLYSMAGPSASSYTQAANSVITLATTPGSTDKLTVYYDDGVAPVNAPTSVSVSNFPATQPVSGTVTANVTFPTTQAVSASSLPLPSGAATAGNQIAGGPQLGSGTVSATTQRVTLATDGPEVTNSTAIKNSVANIPAKGGATIANSTPVNIASDQTVPVSLASVPSHAVTNAGTFAVQATGTITANAGTNLNTSALALESGGNLATVATKMSDGTQTSKIVIPSAFVTGQAKIATTGTAVQLGSNTLTQGVLISSLSTNAASITIGTSSSLTNTVDGTGNGSILTAGSTKSIAATNTNLVWINGTAGDIISFIGS